MSVFFKLLIESVKVKPRSITSDFEKAIMNAVVRVLDCKTYGCFFHFSQSLYRRIQNDRLVTHYFRIDSFRDHFHMVQSLAYLPPMNVQKGFDCIYSQTSKETIGFFNYVIDTYIGSSSKAPRYSIEFWSVYERTLNNLPTTTNNLEAWHNAITVLNNII